jgi:hypothetical protein
MTKLQKLLMVAVAAGALLTAGVAQAQDAAPAHHHAHHKAHHHAHHNKIHAHHGHAAAAEHHEDHAMDAGHGNDFDHLNR